MNILIVIICSVVGMQSEGIALGWASSVETPLVSSVEYEQMAPLLSDILSFSESQFVAAERIFRDHEQRFAAFATRGREVRMEMGRLVRDSRVGPPDVLDAMLRAEEALAHLADQQARLDEQYFSELFDVLSEPQQDHWERFRAAYRRVNILPRLTGGYAERNLDLIALFNELEFEIKDADARRDIDALLLAYELEMDSALQQLIAHEIERNRQMMRTDRDQWVSTDDGNSLSNMGRAEHDEAHWREESRVRQLHARPADINRRYCTQIIHILPPESAATWLKRYRRESLKRLFDPAQLTAGSFVQLRILNSDDFNLSNDQMQIILALLGEHLAAAADQEFKILDAHRRLRDLHYEWYSGEQRHHRREALRQAIERRAELEDLLVTRVWDLLSPSQRTHLERPPTYTLAVRYD